MARARKKLTSKTGWRGRLTGAEIAERLLAWYDANGRNLPWRRRDQRKPDPYVVWLSEIMLQQTTVETVKPRFLAFLRRWPDIAALARADLDEVLTEWAGLGYYARARNLHRCSRLIAQELAGRFPETESELLTLPGVGAYTAAAISAIAFGKRAVVVDGNVERVMSRLSALDIHMPAAKPTIREILGRMVPDRRPGDFAQALMDLGAMICTPTSPRCASCPWRVACKAHAAGAEQDYPRRAPKPDRKRRFGVVFWIVDECGHVALRRRPTEGLLGGMMEVPGTPWRDRPWPQSEATELAPVKCQWRWLEGRVNHVFTHINLDLNVAVGNAKRCAVGDVTWTSPDRFDEIALPTVMRKVARLALDAAPRSRAPDFA